MTSCHYGNARMVELLINANAHLDLVDINSNTAWQLALENSYSDCVQTILNEMGKFLN
jgi:ankyrin repeat protein